MLMFETSILMHNRTVYVMEQLRFTNTDSDYDWGSNGQRRL